MRLLHLNRFVPYAALGAFAVLLLWPLCNGQTLYWGDILLYFEPMLRYAQHELQTGRLPLWNPYILCGQPYVGNPQMSVFYPSTLLLYIVPAWVALNVTTIVHLFLCGAFMYLFLRRWTVHDLPATAGALVYMGSAYLLGRLQFPPMVQTAAYFPLLFALLDMNLDQPSPSRRGFLSVTVALTILAAHTQVAYLTFGSGMAYTFMRLWRRRADPIPQVLHSALNSGGIKGTHRVRVFLSGIGSVARGAAPLCTAASAGLFLAAIYLLPAFQLLRDSPREQMSVGQANRFFADFPHVLGVVFPRFTGHPITRDFWARGNAWEPAWFVGWVPLGLAAYASLRCRKENLVRFWLALGLVGIWLSLGSVGGLYWLAFYVVPGLGNFHDPARFLLWTTVAMSVLTSVGMDALQLRHWQCSYRPALIATAAIVVPLLWFAGDWLPTTTPATLNRVPTVLPAIRAVAGTNRIALPSNMLYWKRIVTDGYSDYGSADARSIQRTIDTMLSNLDMGNGLESASGYEPIPIAGHLAVEGLSRLAQQRREPNAARLTRLLDVGVIVLPAIGGASTVGFRAEPRRPSLGGTPLALWTNSEIISRSWLVRDVYRVEGRSRIAAALAAPEFDPARSAIVSGMSLENLSRFAKPSHTWSATQPKAVVWRRVLPGKVELSADAGLDPALLVYSGTAYPGWKATIDGTATPIVCADGALLGVALPPGKHAVELKYVPDMFRVGAYLSMITAAIFAAIFTVGIMGRRNRSVRRGS